MARGYVKETAPGWETALMDIVGGNLDRLTDNDYCDFGAHWNHDGTKVLCVSDSARRSAEKMENGVLPRNDICAMNGGKAHRVRVANHEWSEEKGDFRISLGV